MYFLQMYERGALRAPLPARDKVHTAAAAAASAAAAAAPAADPWILIFYHELYLSL